ncbi:hypothetical protein [Sphingobacterium sp. MYb382]|uniref:hypothetical protein n=1 Tax=Sphingobacterium sp. MYb382 TaxID=2745278 RepID=UPI0030AB75CC
MDWNISGNEFGESPNIKSELIFRDIESLNIGVEFLKKINKKNIINMALEYSKKRNGTIVDVDYLDDNRKNVYNYETYPIKQGHSFTVNLSYAYNIINTSAIILSLGPSIQRLSNHYPIQDLNINLDSFYKFKKSSMGGFIKIEHSKIIDFTLANSLYFTKLKTTGYWNLRKDLHNPSFEQYINGPTYILDIKATYPLYNYRIGLMLCYMDFFGKKGEDYTYTVEKTIKARLNELNYTKYNFALTISKSFKP